MQDIKRIDPDIKDEPCGICQQILIACTKLGDKNFCKIKIEDLKRNNINVDKFLDDIKNRFGEKDFNKALQE